MRVVGHRMTESCPRCKKPRYCDDCGVCAACEFCAPEIDPDEIDPDESKPLAKCDECGCTISHGRTCSVTIAAAGS